MYSFVSAFTAQRGPSSNTSNSNTLNFTSQTKHNLDFSLLSNLAKIFKIFKNNRSRGSQLHEERFKLKVSACSPCQQLDQTVHVGGELRVRNSEALFPQTY